MRSTAKKIAAPAFDDGRKRYYDARFQATAVRVLPGEHYVTNDPTEMIVTILGSCVSACIRDPSIGVAGMNHFMLPASDNGEWGSKIDAAMRYGNFAMEMLINDLQRRGARRERLEIKVFGGGHIGNMQSDVGKKNARFVLEYLASEGLKPVASDLGGDHARRIHYFPADGRVKRLNLQRVEASRLTAEETKYKQSIEVADIGGDIELFD